MNTLLIQYDCKCQTAKVFDASTRQVKAVYRNIQTEAQAEDLADRLENEDNEVEVVEV